MGKVELKIPRRYMDSLNPATKGMECVFIFSDKCFRVARDDLDHVPMKGLGLKPLIIRLGFAKEI